MSKRNIAYIKPQDPKFLQQLKQQISYKEGPSVETKRQKLEDLHGELGDGIEQEDERPQIVVVNAGDLTAEEVATEEKRLEKEIAESHVDLSKPIVFRKPHKHTEGKVETASFSNHKNIERSKEKKTIRVKSSLKLSFNFDEEEE